MNLSEKLADATTTRQLNLLRYDASLRKDVNRILEDVEAEIIAKLNSGKQWSEFALARLNEQLKSVRSEIGNYYSDIKNITVEGLQELAKNEAQWQVSAVNKAATVDLMTATPSAAQLVSIAKSSLIQGAINKDWWERQSQDLQFRFLTQIKTGVAQGETNQQLSKRIRSIMDISRRNAEALVRTSVQTIAAEARRETISQNQDVVKGIQQVSTLDGRTTDICMAYSGAAWDLNKKPIGEKNLPYNSGVPRHWQCRSFEIAVTKSFKELGLNIDEFPSTTRTSMDGEVAGDLSFDDWLKAKPKAFQEEMLGKGRAELFQSGKITLTDLVNGNGRPLTLNELKKRI
jgi:SPP1 gp7 family putative phage head morphogenesis protein